MIHLSKVARNGLISYEGYLGCRYQVTLRCRKGIVCPAPCPGDSIQPDICKDCIQWSIIDNYSVWCSGIVYFDSEQDFSSLSPVLVEAVNQSVGDTLAKKFYLVAMKSQ